MEYGLFDLTLLTVILAFVTLVLSLPKPKKEEDPWEPLEDVDNKDNVCSRPVKLQERKQNRTVRKLRLKTF